VSRRGGGAAAAVGALGLLALLAAGPAGAEARRVEVVGVAPAGADAAEGVSERQAAIDDALGKAALRVAADLLGTTPEALAAQGGAGALLPRPAAGYALRFRVLEDRGERRALLSPDPEVAHERVLLVEVSVDAERLAADLRAAGRLAAAAPAPGGDAVTVDLEGLETWRAYAGVRDALREAGAREVVPRDFAAGRARLVVEGAPDGRRLLGRLEDRLPEGLEVEALDVASERLRLRVRDRRPPPAPPEAEPVPGAPGA
jgi:hypothetical protein